MRECLGCQSKFWVAALLGIHLLTSIPAAAVNDVTIGSGPTTDLSDWADEFCIADDACDDFPNQQDIKGACIASNHSMMMTADTIFLRFDFDDTGAGGMSDLDGCWLVDVNQNSNVDRALCFELTGTPTATLSSVRFFTCADSSSTGCAMATEMMGSSATCAENNATSGMDKLLDCGDGNDLGVECSISLSDLGWTSGVVSLLSGCSSTSNQPNSRTFDCVGSPENPLIIDPVTGANTPVELLSFAIE